MLKHRFLKKRKIGLKKLTQIEYIRTILDIFVNAYASKYHENKIEELIAKANEKKIFWNIHKLFFDFPFSNIFQTFYSQIMDIVLSEYSPVCLVEYVFKENNNETGKKLVQTLLNHLLTNMKFTFTSNNKSFNPCFSLEISILNKIFSCNNEAVKKQIEGEKDLEVFNEVMPEEEQDQSKYTDIDNASPSFATLSCLA